MKTLLILTFLCFVFNINAQILSGKTAGVNIYSPIQSDSLIVSYLSQDFNKKDPLIFVNGQKVEMILLNSINVDHIDLSLIHI